MTDGNGTAAPDPVLAGHLVIYPDAIAFRPDGGADDEVIVRPIIGMAVSQLVELFTAGDGGMLAAVMNGRIPKMSPKMARQARAMARDQGLVVPNG